MGNVLNSTKAAELVEANTGRPCSRQNLEKLCSRGALINSPCIAQARPLRLDGDLLVAEYLAKVSPHQAEARQPAAKRERSEAAPTPRRHPAASTPPPEPVDLPDYNVSRARSEYEKANLLELDRKTKEGHLLRREDVEQAWGGAVNITRTRLLGVASTARQRIPHLETEEVELITTLIREALEELAAGDLKQ